MSPQKKKFIQTHTMTAVQFLKDEHPWHHSIQRQTEDGKIPDYERFFCIIPMSGIDYIEDRDWIVVDDMNNAQGVLRERDFKMLNISPL
jgi:hypothetical protein